MTDFTYAKNFKCRKCGEPFCDVEGMNCDCDSYDDDKGVRCHDCGEWFEGEKPFNNCFEHMGEDELRELVDKLQSENSVLHGQVRARDFRIKNLENIILAFEEYKAKMTVLNEEWKRAAKEATDARG